MASVTQEDFDKDAIEQLMTLKDLTSRTGALYEAQVLQLKMWPQVLLFANTAEFVFNFEDKTLVFKLSDLVSPRPKHWNKRVKLLQSWSKQLLGEEYQVLIELKGKFIGRSRTKKQTRGARRRAKRSGN
jgi:hypothetical protein